MEVAAAELALRAPERQTQLLAVLAVAVTAQLQGTETTAQPIAAVEVEHRALELEAMEDQGS